MCYIYSQYKYNTRQFFFSFVISDLRKYGIQLLQIIFKQLNFFSKHLLELENKN